ncbi:glycosyl transferase [Sporosarcina trichiuri]|uniref:glycosyl transferase n=1 Tax=Sporosarcina trichiuri TaxID=3056445 RepID=UPI0025B468B1|nr:glycosyl transferase [Sporosarcina sp. 0.2-SM1T-5]WJY28060.1 glycosyl transferase [Sporosarcina sp. 0.2-SM1T-5]
MRKTLLLILSAFFLFGCSHSITGEFATVTQVNQNSVVIENGGGKITEVDIGSDLDFPLEENKEYFFRYETTKRGKSTLISVETIVD